MRCEHCGEILPEAEGPPHRCTGDTRAARGKKPGQAGSFRLLTSLVDRPADPGMVDEAPPPSAARTAVSLGAADEGNAPERRSIAGDRLEEDAPVLPDELRGAAAAVPPGKEARVNQSDDFGEAREIPPPAPAAGGTAGAGTASWGDQWETELRERMRVSAPPRMAKGGFWLRLVAVWIDGLFVSLIVSIAAAAVFSATGLNRVLVASLPALEADPQTAIETLRPVLEPYLGVLALTYLGIALLWTLYRPVCHGAWGRTLGKLVLGLRVVRTDGTPLGFSRAFLRYLGYMIALIPFGLGVLWVAWDDQKQGWHDKIAGTFVIKERE